MDAREKRLKRLAIRSWRRGTKEMDLILGPFWDAHGAALDEDALALYEELLSELNGLRVRHQDALDDAAVELADPGRVAAE